MASERQFSSEPHEEAVRTFTGGEVFARLFKEGIALVEEAAAYLDGPGREQSKTLPREASLTYSAWSMELTSRLMQAASWLVMQKAVRDGDMPHEDARASKYRLRREAPALDASAQREHGLPPVFLDLVERSEALFERICRLDGALYTETEIAPGGVHNQLAELEKAASTGVFDPLSVWSKVR